MYICEACGTDISIRALREEGDSWLVSGDMFAVVFLSTPSARRATKACDKLVYVVVISIHALREEGDLANIGEQAILNKISIHALREEGDRIRLCCIACFRHFYPRPPRGGRR